MSFINKIFKKNNKEQIEHITSQIKINNKDEPKINIVTEPPDKPWVLRMMSERWAEYLPNCTISSMQPSIDADINYYVNWDIYNKPSTIDVGWFTHKEEDMPSANRFDEKAQQMDYCICPSINTLKLLPKNKSCVLKHGIGIEYKNSKNKLIFGIVGTEKYSGRKRFDVVNSYLRAIPNTEFLITNGKLPANKMPDFYKNIDYLLILSNNEGGPVPLLEAFATGTPVIAPDVGWCWEYPIIKYQEIDELINIIKTLSSQINTEKIWEESSNDLLKIFKKLLSK